MRLPTLTCLVCHRNIDILDLQVFFGEGIHRDHMNWDTVFIVVDPPAPEEPGWNMQREFRPGVSIGARCGQCLGLATEVLRLDAEEFLNLFREPPPRKDPNAIFPHNPNELDVDLNDQPSLDDI